MSGPSEKPAPDLDVLRRMLRRLRRRQPTESREEQRAERAALREAVTWIAEQFKVKQQRARGVGVYGSKPGVSDLPTP